MNNYGSSSENRTIHPSLSPASSGFIVLPPPCIFIKFLTSTSSSRVFPRFLAKHAQNYHFADLLLLLLWNAIFMRQSMSRHHLPLPHAILIHAGVFTLRHTWSCYIWTPNLQLWKLNSVWQHHVPITKTFSFQISRWDIKAQSLLTAFSKAFNIGLCKHRQ